MSKRSRRRGGRGMFEIRPGQHRPRNVRNGVIFTVLIVVFLVVLYVKPTVPGFGAKGQVVTLELSSGINIRPGATPVRVQGVDVGQVTDVRRSPSERGVRVKMLVEAGKGVTVHRDASVALRWRTILGRNLYADLRPGSASAPELTAGDVIPRSRTTVQTEVDQAIEPFDETGRAAVRTIIEQFDEGFSSPDGYRRAVRSLGPAMRSLGPGLRSLRGREPGDLQEAIEGTSKVLGALASDEVKLGDLVDNGSAALGVTAARSADLRSLIAAAAPALGQTQATLARLSGTLGRLDPVVQRLRPGARRLDESATSARTVLAAAAPLLRDAKPTVRALQPAVRDLTKLTSSGNALMAAANPVLDDAVYPILPFLRVPGKESEHPTYQMLGPALSAAAGASAWGDRYGSLVNFQAGVGETLIPNFSPCQTQLTNPTVDLQDKVNCEFGARLIVGLLTGTPPDQVVLRNPAAPNAKVDAMFKDKDRLAAIRANLLRNLGAARKGAGR